MNANENTTRIHSVNKLVCSLANPDALKRRYVRSNLVGLGSVAVPFLVEALKSQNVYIRWEAVQGLGEILDPETVPDLVEMLLDEDLGVRWIACESLVGFGRKSLGPLFYKFSKHLNSFRMCEGVHHVLHVLRNRGLLKDGEVLLFKKLDREFIPGSGLKWAFEPGWAVERALDAVDRVEKRAME